MTKKMQRVPMLKVPKKSDFDFAGLPLIAKDQIPEPEGRGRVSPLNELPVLAKLIQLLDYVRAKGAAPYELVEGEDGQSVVIDIDAPEIKEAMAEYKQPKESMRARLKVLLAEREVDNILSLSERGNRFYIFGKGHE